jgi:hypothetical protein
MIHAPTSGKSLTEQGFETGGEEKCPTKSISNGNHAQRINKCGGGLDQAFSIWYRHLNTERSP